MNPILGCLRILLANNSSITESPTEGWPQKQNNNSDNCCPTLGHRTLSCRYLTRNTRITEIEKRPARERHNGRAVQLSGMARRATRSTQTPCLDVQQNNYLGMDV